MTPALPPMRAAWQGFGCESRERDIPSLKWLSPREAEAVLMWALGMPTHPCAGAMAQAAQPHRRQQKPLSVALHIHKPDPAPCLLALAYSVPHMPSLSRFLVDVGLHKGWSGLSECGWPQQGGKGTPPETVVLWGR